MGDKSTTLAPRENVSERRSDQQLPQEGGSPLFGLQQSLGNQALLRLLGAGAIRAKLRVSQPGDPDEIEADRAADRVVSSRTAPAIQRKCACAGGPKCATCAEEEETIQRSPSGMALHPSGLAIQRAAADTHVGQGGAAPAAHAKGAQLIVDDDAAAVGPGQIKKSAFLIELREVVCTTADAALVEVGRTTKSCPYIEKWLSFYSGQKAEYIERALNKYAPETTGAKRAPDYFKVVRIRVHSAVTVWAKTGRVTGVPPGVPMLPAPSLLDGGKASGSGSPQAASQSGAASGTGPATAIKTKSRDAGTGNAADADSVRSRLGAGRALDSSVRSRMEPAFGHSFAHVRLHTDADAAHLSSDLNARAFTIGHDVAFGSGEYRPGTPIGDALIAHELAHVVQQGEAQNDAPQFKADGETGRLEDDADNSAVGAVLSIWQRGKKGIANVSRRALPTLKSGLRLQRCQEVKKRCPKGYSWRVLNAAGVGSGGCLCHWKCLPGEPPGASSAPAQDTISCPPEMNCSTGVRYEDLDDSYEKTGYGASFTPLGEQGYCGCFPLNFEGEQVSNSPLRPTDFEMTDVLAPLADAAAAAKSGGGSHLDPTTGKPKTEQRETAPTRETRPTVEQHEVHPAGDPHAPSGQTGRQGTGEKPATPPPPATRQTVDHTAPAAPPKAAGHSDTPPVQQPAHPPAATKSEDKHTTPPPAAKVEDKPTPPPPAAKVEDKPAAPAPHTQDTEQKSEAASSEKDKTTQKATSDKADTEAKKETEVTKEKEEATKETTPEQKPSQVEGTAALPTAPIGQQQINRVQQLETESQRLSTEASSLEPQVKQVNNQLKAAQKKASDLSNDVIGLKAVTKDAVRRNPNLKSEFERAEKKRGDLKKAQKELTKVEGEYNALKAQQETRYDQIRKNNAEIIKIARPELALKPTLRGIANELRVLKEEGLLGIKKEFTLKDPKTGEIATTIPDGIRPNGRTVDVKDVVELSETQQLRLQREISRRAGQKAEIITGTKTKVSQTMEDNYIIKRRPDLGPQ